MKKLENKTVFITGGLSGTGKACAIEAAKNGANTAIADLKSDLVDSPFLSKASINRRPDFKQHLIDIHPMKRLRTPEEFAKAFIFIACDDSTFITGTALEIDGGYLAQ